MRGATPAQLWEDFVPLVRLEEVFQTLKHDLHLCPICHRWERRVEAPVRFAWIAYAMYWV